MDRIHIILLIIMSFLALSCKKDKINEVIQDVEGVPEPRITITHTNVLLGLYGITEPIEKKFWVYPADADVTIETSTEDVSVEYVLEETIPGDRMRRGILTIAPGEGWTAMREEKSCSAVLTVRSGEETASEMLTIRMDNNGIPYVESFPGSLFVYPYRAALVESFDLPFVSPFDATVEVASTLECIDVSYEMSEESIHVTVKPDEGWNEDTFYGLKSPGTLSLTIANDAGESIYMCPILMPKLDALSETVSFQFHGGKTVLGIMSDVSYFAELVIPEPLVSGDPSEPLWNPNNPNPPSNNPQDWLFIQQDAEGLVLTAMPIKRRGTREAVLRISDEKGVYVRDVALRQDIGGEFDYCDNITDFEALWLLYEQMSPEGRADQEGNGWGSANMRDWEGGLLLQRGERVIHFGWGEDFFPEEMRAFDKMTELQMRNMPVEMRLPDWLSSCPTLDIRRSNFTGPIPEWFSDLRVYSITGCRFYGLVPDCVRKSKAWSDWEEERFAQQEGYYLYYLDDNGNPVDYQGNPLDVPEWQRTDLR